MLHRQADVQKLQVLQRLVVKIMHWLGQKAQARAADVIKTEQAEK